jgi:F-type H+-transporting ATPase subunit alpha
MKLDYLQFLELEVFTRFGTKLEAGAEAKIRRGRLLREILKQERLSPLPAEFQLAWMTAFNAGLLDPLEPARASAQAQAALERLRDGLGRAPLALDAPRDDWLARLRDWLGDGPAP